MDDTATPKTEVILTPEVIAQFSETEKAIAQIETDLGMLTITDIDSKEQYDKVHDGRMALVKMRTQGIEPLKKQLKAPAIAFNNAIDEKANGLTERLKKVEAHLQSEEDKVDARREEARKEKERKNAEKLQQRVDRMKTVNGNMDLVWLRTLTDDLFEDEFNKFQIIFDTKKEEEEEEKKKQIDAKKKLDEEKAELEKGKEELQKSRKAVRHARILSLGLQELELWYWLKLSDDTDYFVSFEGALMLDDEKFNEYCLHVTEIIDNAKKQKEAQDIIDNDNKKKANEEKDQKRIEVLSNLGLVFSPKENSYVEKVPTALCINFHWTDIKCMSDLEFDKTVEKVRNLLSAQRVSESSKSDRELLLEYVDALKAIRIPKVEGAYAKFPAQIARTIENMETLIKNA